MATHLVPRLFQRRSVDPSVPTPPRLRPTWTTWMWIAFIVAVIVLSLLGLRADQVP